MVPLPTEFPIRPSPDGLWLTGTPTAGRRVQLAAAVQAFEILSRAPTRARIRRYVGRFGWLREPSPVSQLNHGPGYVAVRGGGGSVGEPFEMWERELARYQGLVDLYEHVLAVELARSEAQVRRAGRALGRLIIDRPQGWRFEIEGLDEAERMVEHWTQESPMRDVPRGDKVAAARWLLDRQIDLQLHGNTRLVTASGPWIEERLVPATLLAGVYLALAAWVSGGPRLPPESCKGCDKQLKDPHPNARYHDTECEDRSHYLLKRHRTLSLGTNASTP